MHDSRVAGLETKNSRTSERGAQHHRKPRSFAQPFLARLSPTVADAPSGFTKVFDRTNCETCRRARNASPVAVIPGPEIDFPADPDQLEQMLNLIRNAADAVLQVQEVERHSNGSKSSDTDQQIVFSWKSTAERDHLDPRQWTGPDESRQCFRPVLYDEASGKRHRTCAVAPNCRSTWRVVGTGEPSRSPRLPCENHPTD